MADSDSSESWLKGLVPFVVMCVGMFIALLDIQIVASSLQNIGGGLSAAQDEISWVQTAYLIAEIIVIPMSGWLTRVFSTRWLFTFSAAGFTLAAGPVRADAVDLDAEVPERPGHAIRQAAVSGQ